MWADHSSQLLLSLQKTAAHLPQEYEPGKNDPSDPCALFFLLLELLLKLLHHLLAHRISSLGADGD